MGRAGALKEGLLTWWSLQLWTPVMASSAVPCWSPEFNALEVILGGDGGYPRLFPLPLLGHLANSSSHLLPLEGPFQDSDLRLLFLINRAGRTTTRTSFRQIKTLNLSHPSASSVVVTHFSTELGPMATTVVPLCYQIVSISGRTSLFTVRYLFI